MTRNHSAVSRGLQQFLGRKYDYKPKNQFEEQYAHYPTETVERIRNQVSLSALKALIVHMGSLKEGRKSLILVSEGYTYMLPPQMRNADAQHAGLGQSERVQPDRPGRTTSTRIAPPGRPASTWTPTCARSTTPPTATTSRSTPSIRAACPGFEFDINEGVGIQTDTKYLSSTMDTLRTLAENTDGRAIVNRNDLATGMKQITRDTSAYYLIGYNSAQAPTDGKFHEIKVQREAARRSGPRAARVIGR